MRFRHVWTLVMAFALAAVWSGSAQAQSNNATRTFQLQPGGKATIEFESFCIDYGKKFPTTVGLPPTNVAEPTVVGALNNALTKGYTSSQPKEVQYAIWKARGAQGSPAVGAAGAEIAQNLTPPTAPTGATSVTDAIKNNQVKATAGTWAGIGEKLTINGVQDNFQGRGQLQIENTSGQTLTLYMPIGTVFPAPSAEFQSMAGYLTNVTVNNPQQTQQAQQSDQQALPTTGIADLNATQFLLLSLIGINIAAIGIMLQGRARVRR